MPVYPFSSAASAFFSQYVMPMSRYIVVAVVKCSCACSRLSVRQGPAHLPGRPDDFEP